MAEEAHPLFFTHIRQMHVIVYFMLHDRTHATDQSPLA